MHLQTIVFFTSPLVVVAVVALAIFSLSFVTVPEAFAKVNSTQSVSHF